MASFASSLISKYDLGKDVEVNGNLKLFFGQYPHRISLTYRKHRSEDFEPVLQFRRQAFKLKERLRGKLTPYSASTRIEWYTMRIFTTDLEKVLAALQPDPRLFFISIDVMDSDVLAYLRTKPEESYKASNTIVKNLPWKKYRYKIHYATHGNDKRKIGSDALQAIAAQLSSDSSIRWSKELHDNVISNRTVWHSTYFYAEDIDWLPMILLISNKFIKKIEHLTLESEIAR